MKPLPDGMACVAALDGQDGVVRATVSRDMSPDEAELMSVHVWAAASRARRLEHMAKEEAERLAHARKRKVRR